jgi:hypothetical protein
MPSDLPRQLSRLVNSRKAADYLDRLLQTHLDQIEAQHQRAKAEIDFKILHGDKASHAKEIAKCANGADGLIHWFRNWAWTFDPRLIAENKTPYVRFIPWPKQEEFLRALHVRVSAGKPFLLEKSRDQGATYLLVGYAIWRWLFCPGFKTTFCSNDAENVDSKGNPDSIFEKMRIIVRRLPLWMMPEGVVERKHDLVMQLTNPINGAVITGVTGENPGRGGRSSWFVADEAAYIANAKRVEAAVSGNTDCVGWVSTPNPENGGLANFFAQKRAMFAKIPGALFRLHWRDDPRKNDAWATEKKATLADPSTWDVEYEISYTGAQEGVAIPAKWVQAAVDLGRDFGVMVPRAKRGISGGDVGAGKANSVIVHRFGPLVLEPERRQEADTTDTAIWMLDCMVTAGSHLLNFDVPGVGAGVLSAFTHLDRAKYPTLTGAVPINTGNPPSDRVWPDETTSDAKFGNLKAEIWWLARAAFQRSYLHYQWLTKQAGGIEQKWNEVLVIPDDATLAMQLSTPKWFRNEKGKIVIETKKQLAVRHIASPDDADAFVLTFIEEPVDHGTGLEIGKANKDLQQDNPFVIR